MSGRMCTEGESESEGGCGSDGVGAQVQAGGHGLT